MTHDPRATLTFSIREDDRSADAPMTERDILFNGILTAAFDRDGHFYLYNEDGLTVARSQDGFFIDPIDGARFYLLSLTSWPTRGERRSESLR